MGIRGRQVSLRAAAERPMTLDSLAFAFYYQDQINQACGQGSQWRRPAQVVQQVLRLLLLWEC